MNKKLSLIRTDIIKHSIKFVLFFTLFYILPSHNFIAFFCVLLSLFNFFLLLTNVFEYINEKKFQELKNNKEYQHQKAYYDSLINDILNNMNRQGHYQYRQPPIIRSRNELTEAYQLFKLSPSCTVDDIKKTYRKFATTWHPDKWSTDTLENQEISKRNFQKLNAAYEVFKKYRNFN